MILSGGGGRSLFNRPLREGSPSNMAATAIDSVIGRRHRIRGDGPDALAALRALDAGVITGGQDLAKTAKLKLFGGPLHGVPVVDGTIITAEPEQHFVAGAFRKVPLVIGTVAVDAPAHFPPNKVHPLEWFGDDEAAAHAAYGVPDHRFLPPERLVRLLLAIGADMTMHEPAHFVASTMTRAGQPAWVYRFTYTAESTRPENMAQVHADELPWMFDTLNAVYGDAVTPNDQAMADAFNTYVANFVKTGDPNGAGLPPWPQVVPDEYDLMHFMLDDGPVFGPDPRPSVELVARARRAHSS
jgi:para-nitrobenzyl esterase